MRALLTDYYARHGDKLRFLVVGVFNTAFGYLLFLIMLEAFQALVTLPGVMGGLPPVLVSNYYLLAQWTAWVLSVPVGAMTLKYLVFRSKGHLVTQIGRAYLVYLPGLALSSATLWFTVQVIGLSPELGQLIAIAVTVVFSYLGHKHFTFRDASASA